MTDKPDYSVPTMTEINELPWNGLNVISTFAGGGGSSLGYRMAGFKVRVACEFVPAAADTYESNAASYTVVCRDDIREVSGQDLLDLAGLEVGELDILDGSPPCAAFSTAGKKSKGWGEVKSYSDTKQRVDDLFYDFARLVREIRPRVFVAENVAGLIQGEAKGYFKRIHQELQRDGYRVQAQLLDAQWLGVPQMRRRLIFVGVRDDQPFEPVFPDPLPYRYSMQDALPHLDGQVAPGPTVGNSWAENPSWREADRHPSATIGASFSTGNGRFPPGVVADQFIIKGFSGSGNSERDTDQPVPTITATGSGAVNTSEAVLGDRMLIKEMGSKTALKARSVALPSPAVMASGIGGVGWQQAMIEQSYDMPLACPETGQDLRAVSPKLRNHYPDRALRRLSIPEVRRLCSFPMDYELVGGYGKRWERMGRAVPPLMMRAIASKLNETMGDGPCAG